MYFCAIIMKNTTMWKENLYQQVEILLREHDEFPIGEHQHSFFEMTYIRREAATSAHTRWGASVNGIPTRRVIFF